MEDRDVLFETKYQQYHETIYRIACSYASKRIDVEDIVQDVFLQYFTKAPQFDSDDHERFWLIRVTINIAKNYNKLAWNRRVSLDEDIIYLYHSEKTKEEDYLIIEAIKALPKKYKEVIILFYYEDLSAKEIANILNITISNVNIRLMRGRERIKKILEMRNNGSKKN